MFVCSGWFSVAVDTGVVVVDGIVANGGAGGGSIVSELVTSVGSAGVLSCTVWS